MTSKPPGGQRFSHVYIDRGEPTGDSPRMRHRLMSEVLEMPKHLRDSLVGMVGKELGVPWSTWGSFFKEAETRDVLDFVTLAYRCIRQAPNTGRWTPATWVNSCRRIFTEENLHYCFDDSGGAHFRYDQEFDRNCAATIAALENGRYANALQAFNATMADLAEAPPNGKLAIRAVFSAVECVFRLILPKAPRLAAAELEGLTPIIQQLYERDETAKRSAAKMLNSLKDWVDAAHFYRHEGGSEEPAKPPLRFAVYIVSCGASHLRWLAEIDGERTAVQASKSTEHPG